AWRCRLERNGIIRIPSPPCAARSQPTWLAPCPDVPAACANSYNTVVLGALCVVGHQTACAELTVPLARSKSMRFSGLLAWLMWRGIYLGKLPGLERKIRVLVDWTVELFFPKDIVQTIDLR